MRPVTNRPPQRTARTRRSAFALSTLAMLALAGATMAPAIAGQQDFTLVNRTGYGIDSVYE